MGILINDAVSMIWQLGQPFIQYGVHYQWEGRQVIDYGNDLVVTTLDDGWNFRVSGYQLTSP
jgi:hypothetical protein